MTDFDLEGFEAELRRSKPAPVPPTVLQKLKAVPLHRAELAGGQRAPRRRTLAFPGWFRWGAVAGAAVLIFAAVLVGRHFSPPKVASASRQTERMEGPRPVFKADRVEIDRLLLTSFDAIANLPTGEPVRFHCREWLDEVVVRDSSRGVVIERQAPRLEVVPVRFETY